MDKELTKKMVSRLNKIEGQVRGVKGMIEQGKYCDDILTQIASVQASMGSVAKILLDSHIKTCISPRLAEGDEGAVDELIKTVGRLM
ncbi:MAG: metal-sensitive transcriptional regulator [Defluviitaleaceae bacterium]|nr:metal-sensitive transcriptional regulator [Defluviitaleaceae bacterium]